MKERNVMWPLPAEAGVRLDAAIATFSHADICSGCRSILPMPPAPRVCPNPDCARVFITPHHETWSPELKGYLIREYVRQVTLSGLSPQHCWERVLLAAFKGRTVAGRHFRWATQPDDVYQLAVRRADRWAAAGQPLGF